MQKLQVLPHTRLERRDALKSNTWRKNDAAAIVKDLEDEEAAMLAKIQDLEGVTAKDLA